MDDLINNEWICEIEKLLLDARAHVALALIPSNRLNSLKKAIKRCRNRHQRYS